jgi:hypothetical protein
MRTARLLLWAALTVAGLRAAPLERDLGLGLAYLRVHALPGDLAVAPAAGRPLVLDLRYVHGGPAEAAGLLAWLRLHAGPRMPVFLLANGDTSPALLAPLSSPEAVNGLVIVGAAAPGFDPDLTLAVTPEAERHAYDALEAGATIESLTVASSDKVRNDEAMLAKARQADTADEDEAARPEEKARPALPPQVIDPVLQRAVQLHRSLRALKRV